MLKAINTLAAEFDRYEEEICQGMNIPRRAINLCVYSGYETRINFYVGGRKLNQA